MLTARVYIELTPEAIENGYRNCQSVANRFFRPVRWIIGNFPAGQRRELAPILFHVVRTIELLNLQSDNGLPLDLWHEIRDDLSDAFLDKCTSVELAALADTARKHQIPKQFLFDPIFGADIWMRNRKFKTYDELSSFACQTGGSLLAAAVPVMGLIKPHYEVAAIECGKAMMLTQLLANLANDAKLNKIFVAQDDLQECEIEIQRLKLRQTSPTLKHLVRLYCWRIEKSLTEGSKLLRHLDYDARRSVTSLLAWHWRMVTQMKLEPDSVLHEQGCLRKGDLLKLRARHLLGIEGNVSFLDATLESNHH